VEAAAFYWPDVALGAVQDMLSRERKKERGREREGEREGGREREREGERGRERERAQVCHTGSPSQQAGGVA
jgi:hypothetical protein